MPRLAALRFPRPFANRPDLAQIAAEQRQQPVSLAKVAAPQDNRLSAKRPFAWGALLLLLWFCPFHPLSLVTFRPSCTPVARFAKSCAGRSDNPLDCHDKPEVYRYHRYNSFKTHTLLNRALAVATILWIVTTNRRFIATIATTHLKHTLC